ncbi:hypothetical protein GJU84_04940 [Staphylococcus chromogenes]|uniref:Uncharacterized protein n=1 Tax=Staphylococcus agnetis TaxID=985762 RepID=A0ABX3Z2I8_9STAP|nr:MULTISPECIES: hypothetical protein [Staphylococcus]ALN76741.1 hypothetical protein EP23_04750 [Staphylococcus agnetis]MDG4942800.1 hypothetical protein [Staphylococcus agnetis]OSP20438.1 hypothetical protein B9L42_05655 [Staphylococcus agnetis]OSP25119.1 hypothetical protein B9M87_00770 [Staphylococcus agnetis]OTW31144.1 hypothetical protein B9M88_06700 [Staphylococcus agnetis]
MNIISKFYKNINKDLGKFSSSFAKIISPTDKQTYINNANVYQHQNSSSEDWKKINGDYCRVGNDIRKAIKNYAK